jgi:hypothetical protein
LICDFCFGEFLHYLQQSFCASSGKTSLCLLYSIPSTRFLDHWPEKESYWMRACWGLEDGAHGKEYSLLRTTRVQMKILSGSSTTVA